MSQYKFVKRTFLLSGLVAVGLAQTSCTINEPLITEPYESGVIVYDALRVPNTPSVAFINRQTGLVRFTTPKIGSLPTDLFSNLNSRSLGDSVFSYAEVNGKGFLVLPKTDQIEIVEASTFRSISQLGGAEAGRYVVGLNALKAYASYWGGKTVGPGVAVIDVTARRTIKRIPVSSRPEQMAVVGDELFVTNVGTSTDPGKTITIINTASDEVVGSIAVGDVPTSVVYDPSTKLMYVLCAGRSVNTAANGLTTAELVRINPVTRQVVGRTLIGGRPIAGNPSNLAFDSPTNTLYFLWRGNVHRTTPMATSIALDQPIVTRTVGTFGYDPIGNLLYAARSNGAAKQGVVYRYRATGTLLDSIVTEAAPTGFYFK